MQIQECKWNATICKHQWPHAVSDRMQTKRPIGQTAQPVSMHLILITQNSGERKKITKTKCKRKIISKGVSCWLSLLLMVSTLYTTDTSHFCEPLVTQRKTIQHIYARECHAYAQNIDALWIAWGTAKRKHKLPQTCPECNNNGWLNKESGKHRYQPANTKK